MITRLATKEDVDQLVVLTRALARETEGKRLDEKAVRRGIFRLIRGPNTRLYIARRSAKAPVVAFVSVSGWEWSEWTATKHLWLGAAYVAKEYRGDRIVGTILETVARHARRVGASGLRSYVAHANKDSEAAHAAYGFTKTHYVVFEKSVTRHRNRRRR